MGLPKRHRLKRRQDFSFVYQRGVRFKSGCFTLRAYRHRSSAVQEVPSGSQEMPRATRIGISISLKVDKRSVVRNRIRRQLQAAFRQLLPRLEAGWDLLIVVQSPAVRCDYFQFLQELEQLLVEAEVLNAYPRGCVL